MSEVTLKINNRGYCLSCDNGQEQHLTDLAHFIDSRLRDIAAAGAATNESHLLVLTSLVLADELYDMKDQLSQAQRQLADIQRGVDDNASQALASQKPVSHEEEEMVARAITHLAEKIERIATRLQDVEDSAAA
ncbi:MAG: cell division protein ZapA [Alphaproteobacteria bacterium]